MKSIKITKDGELVGCYASLKEAALDLVISDTKIDFDHRSSLLAKKWLQKLQFRIHYQDCNQPMPSSPCAAMPNREAEWIQNNGY